MKRKEINILRKTAPGWLYLQEHTRMHGQQKIQKFIVGIKMKFKAGTG